MRTADDDSVPVPHDALRLPRAVLNWKTPPARGVAARAQRDELEPEDTDVTRVDMPSGLRTSARAAGDELDDEPTRAIQVYVPPRTPEPADALQQLLERGATYLSVARVRAAGLWRDGPLRTAAMVAGAVLLTYLAVGGVRRGSEAPSQKLLVPAAALPATAPIIVEQLSGAPRLVNREAVQRDGEQSEQPARRSASSRARVTSSAPTAASKNNGYHVIAPAQLQPQSSRAQRPSATVKSSSAKSSSAGLPAWGAEAVREFSGGKSSSADKSVTSRSQALNAKPSSSNADIPPPMAGYRPSAREQPKAVPVVAAKPPEPPKPVEPPKPSKPLTMDQVLNQVEEAAQAQRKKEGLKAPKTSKRDEELDALINGAMKSKGK